MMSFAEIAVELGLTEGQVLNIYRSALRKVRARTPPSAISAYQQLLEDEPEWVNDQMEDFLSELESGWGFHIEDSLMEDE